MKAPRLALAAPLLVAAASEPSAIRVEVSAVDGGETRTGTPLHLRVSARDPATGYALTTMTPALWLVPDDGEQGERRCERMVNRLTASASPPEGTIDANGFDLIQATEDGRLALVDPVLNLASANIKAMLDPGGVPTAWAIDPAGTTLLISAGPDPALLVVDMNRFAVAQRLALKAAPSAIVAQGERFWVGAADGTVTSIGNGSHASAPIRIGKGAVYLSASDDTVVALTRSGDGAFLHGEGMSRPFALGAEIKAVAYAALGDAAYALSSSGDVLFSVPQDQPNAHQRLALTRKARDLTVSPDGRWLALVAADGGAVTILDVATGRERWTVAANDPVVAAGFSDAFLYLAHKRQGGATRVVFDPSGGPPATVTIAAGSNNDEDNTISPLAVMTRIPGAGMLIASTRDRTAYMINDDNAQAAMSSLPLRAGRPAGILLRYRGLTPTREGGDYIAQAVAPRGGNYLAVVRTERPAIAHCTSIRIKPAPGEVEQIAAKRAAQVARTLTTDPLLPPGEQILHFSISGPPVQLLGTMLIGDGWQSSPPDIRSAANGGYDLPVHLQEGGGFTLFVRYQDASGEMILSTPIMVASR